MATQLKSLSKQVEITCNNTTVPAIQVQLDRKNNGVRSVCLNVTGLAEAMAELNSYQAEVEKDKTDGGVLAQPYCDLINDYIQLLTNLRNFVEEETKISAR